jgi:DUF1365 family protein
VVSGVPLDPPRPGVYVGTVRHRRRQPVDHTFVYPLFMVLLDIDRIPELMRVSPFTSHNRWNWASFRETDHLRAGGAGRDGRAGDAASLRDRLSAAAASAGLVLPEGPVFLLTHLRYLGYVFNPISFFYCCDRTGRVRRVLAEVSNTFGGSHNYWLDAATGDEGRGPLRAAAAKRLYVSPFMAHDLTYRFSLTSPGHRLVAHIDAAAAGRPHFDATLSLERRPWTARELHRALAQHPWMTAKVIGAIHWEAFRLWRKGLRVVPRGTPTGERQDDRHDERPGTVGVLRDARRHPGRIAPPRLPGRPDVSVRRV